MTEKLFLKKKNKAGGKVHGIIGTIYEKQTEYGKSKRGVVPARDTASLVTSHALTVWHR